MKSNSGIWQERDANGEALCELSNYLASCKEYEALKYVGFIAARLSDVNWDADKLISQNLKSAQINFELHKSFEVPYNHFYLSEYRNWPALPDTPDKRNIKLNAFLKYHYSCGRFLNLELYVDKSRSISEPVFKSPSQYTVIIEKAFGQLYLYGWHMINALNNDNMNYTSMRRNRFNELSKDNIFYEGKWVVEDNIQVFRLEIELRNRKGHKDKPDNSDHPSNSTYDKLVPEL